MTDATKVFRIPAGFAVDGRCCAVSVGAGIHAVLRRPGNQVYQEVSLLSEADKPESEFSSTTESNSFLAKSSGTAMRKLHELARRTRGQVAAHLLRCYSTVHAL